MLAIHNGSAQFVGSSASDALTSVLYSGEPFDAKIAQQYLRARWYDPATGRFNRLDPFSGNMTDPQSLHKYLYVHGDPVMGVDPSGLYGLGGFMAGFGIATSIRNMKISADLAALDAVKATIDGIRAGRSVQQILFTIVWQELVGAGLGFAFGKALGLFGAVWENGVGFGANRQAIREFFQSGAPRINRVFRSLGLWRGKPDLPMPKRELSRRLAGKMAASDRWIAVEASETEMAAFAHSLPDEEVIAWGWRPNEGGPDVISVNRKTGEVTLWDAKWSGTEKSKLSFTIDNNKKAKWVDQARQEIRDNTSLPKDVKAKALTNLRNGSVRTVAVGYGTLEGQSTVLVLPLP